MFFRPYSEGCHGLPGSTSWRWRSGSPFQQPWGGFVLSIQETPKEELHGQPLHTAKYLLRQMWRTKCPSLLGSEQKRLSSFVPCGHESVGYTSVQCSGWARVQPWWHYIAPSQGQNVWLAVVPINFLQMQLCMTFDLSLSPSLGRCPPELSRQWDF